MKATGIVRRIDDLGRIVIPKEIRRTMRIREGDPLEIYTDKDGGVIFKKYSLMGGLGDFAGHMCETLNKTTGEIAVITDRDSCIAVAGSGRRDLADKQISAALEQIMEGRQICNTSDAEVALQLVQIPVKLGIGCISDNEPQPLLVQSHFGRIDIASAHFQEVGTSVFVGDVHKLFHVIDFTHRCDGKTAEM